MKIFISIVVLIVALRTSAQSSRDTARMISDLGKAMMFSTRPDLSFTVRTEVTLDPAISLPDSTSHAEGVFYKHNDDLYYGNASQETYLQDSLIVRVDFGRKAILVGKVDVATKAKMDLLPLKEADLRKMLRAEYTIERKKGEEGLEQLVLRPKINATKGQEIVLEYESGSYLLKRMAMTVHLRQPASPPLEQMLSDKGIDVGKIKVSYGGHDYLSIAQTVTVSFSGISLDPQKASGMPSWKAVLSCEGQGNDFVAKGKCEGYTVTKTF